MTYEEAARELFNLRGVNMDGSGRRQWGAFTNRTTTAGGQVRPKMNRPGFYESGKQGVAPTAAEIRDFWIANGGGRGRGPAPGAATMAPSIAPMADMSGAAGYAPSSPAAGAGSAYEQMLLKTAGSLEKQTAAANKENIDRFKEEKALKAGVYQRGMGEVGNWGNVQAQLNAETSRKNLDAINADLTERGLSNATNRMAAKLEADRNLALVQQDLSEKKSDRMVQYDRTLAGDLGNVIRSRTDNAPNPNQLMEIYAKLGQAQAIEQARQAAAAGVGPGSGKPAMTLAERMAQLKGGGGPQRGMPASMTRQYAISQGANFQGNLAGAMGYIPTNPYLTAWDTNAYPHAFGEGRYAAYNRRVYGTT